MADPKNKFFSNLHPLHSIHGTGVPWGFGGGSVTLALCPKNMTDTTHRYPRTASIGTPPMVANIGGVDPAQDMDMRLNIRRNCGARGQLDTDSDIVRSRSHKGRQSRTTWKRQTQRYLEISTWNISSLNGKECELVEEAKKYKLDIVGLSSTKRKGSGILDLNSYKLFYSGCDPTTRAMAGVGILTSTRLAERVIDWIPVSMRIGILKVKLDKSTLNFVQVYAPNKESEYESFIDELESALDSIPDTESYVILGDFNAHVGSDAQGWKGVIGMNGDSSLNSNGVSLLGFVPPMAYQ